MKKRIFVFFSFVVFFIILEKLGAEEIRRDVSAVEQLWELVINENPTVQDAARNIRISEYDLKNYWKSFLPVFSVSSASSFSDNFKEKQNIPENIVTSLCLSEQLPGGMTINITPSVSFELENDEKKIQCAEIGNISISLTQKISPFWKDEGKGFNHFEKEKSKLNNELCIINYKMTVLEEIEEITEQYLQYRISKRNVESLERKITFLEEILKAYEQSRKTGILNLQEVYEKEEELSEYKKELISEKNTQENICFQMSKKINKREDDMFLYKLLNSKTYFPEISKPFFSVDPNYEYLLLQQEINSVEYKINKQNVSPLFSINGSFPLFMKYDDNSLRGMYLGSVSKEWNVSLGIDLSVFLVNDRKRMDLEYANRNVSNKEKLEQYKFSLVLKKKMYETLLEDVKRQKILEMKNLGFYQEVFDAKKELFDRNEISYMELRESEIEVESKRIELQNLEDYRWYYMWLINNIVL